MAQFDFDGFVNRLQLHMPNSVIVKHVAFGAVSVTYLDGVPSFNDASEALRRGDVEIAVWAILSHVQDHVVLCLRRAWPEMRGNIAIPQVTRHGGVLHAWFGTATEVVVDLGTFPA